MSHERRVALVDGSHPRLGIVRQCELVGIARSSYYYMGKGETPLNLELMRIMDEQFLKTPWYGSRQSTPQDHRRHGAPTRRLSLGGTAPRCPTHEALITELGSEDL